MQEVSTSESKSNATSVLEAGNEVTDATRTFESAIADSKRNIEEAAEPKRGRGRPRKSVHSDGTIGSSDGSGPMQPLESPASGSPQNAPVNSGFPKGTFGRAWAFGAGAVAARTGYKKFELTDEESQLLDEATEPVAAKWLPADSLESRPVLGLIFTAALIFGPKTFSYLSEQKEREARAKKEEQERIEKERAIAQPEAFPVTIV